MSIRARQFDAERAPFRHHEEAARHMRPSVTPVISAAGAHLQRHASCACGGDCPRCQAEAPAQAKLKVSAPDDAYEREADSVAEQVMSMPGREGASVSAAGAAGGPDIQRSSSPGEDETRAPLHIMTKGLYGQSCDSAPDREEEEEEETVGADVMRKATAGETPRAAGDMRQQLSRSRGGGHPLPAPTRAFMETRFGRDFDDVRVHTDGDAAQMTKDLRAEAFTTGRDIYFRPGMYAPETSAGKRLLAHELTHVVQQRGSDIIGRSAAGDGEDWIQRFTLNGFPAAEEAAMKAAIPAAKATILGCSGRSARQRTNIADAIQDKRYDYEKNLGICGWTFPSSWYIQIGPSAFNPSSCCTLASTIAHEASHTQWFTERRARKLECDCFSCSC